MKYKGKLFDILGKGQSMSKHVCSEDLMETSQNTVRNADLGLVLMSSRQEGSGKSERIFNSKLREEICLTNRDLWDL